MNAQSLLTLPEAADYLQVSKSWLYKRAEARDIPFYRVGRRLLFDPSELDSFVASCRVEAEGARYAVR